MAGRNHTACAMCYSSQIIAEHRKFVRKHGAILSLKQYVDIFWRRSHEADSKIRIPKAMEAGFAVSETDGEREVKALIDQFSDQEAVRLEQELFKQRRRLVDAERTLQTKVTKAATESKRIAADKVDWALGKLADLKRTELQDRDSRIFPGWYMPIMIMQEGQRVVVPMRYGCRPAGKPAFYDTKYPGTYNARRDNLEGFWKGQFGHHHGIMLATAFYENVAGPTGNVVLEFKPRPQQEMLVACLWSHWTAPGEPDLWSCAAITDEPPEEVAAAGHDRCIIPIKPEHIDAWLQPDRTELADQYTILDDRERPYYEHRLAA
jgi:putative SOS response-associated peptidase YedK